MLRWKPGAGGRVLAGVGVLLAGAIVLAVSALADGELARFAGAFLNAAPFVLLAMLRRSATWRRQVLWLNIAGLLDFIGAVGTGALSSNNSIGLIAHGTTHVSLGSLPLSLIPTFAVPLWTLFHIVSLLQLARTAGTVSAREATVAAAAI